MKTRILIFASLLLFVLSGCIVKSLHQFYQEDDVIYDNTLLGSWLDEDSTLWVIKPYTFAVGFMKGDSIDNSYLVELYEDANEPQKFNAHLFELGGKKYLDFRPLRDDRYDDFLDVHLISAHSLALIEINDQGSLTIGWFNEDWLGKLFEENRVKISHEVVKGESPSEGSEYVLTASTDELQKFILKYGVPGENGLCVDDDNFLCIQLTRNEP